MRVSETNTLVSALKTVWHSGAPLTVAQATYLAPSNNAEAYRVQKQLGEELGWWAAGRPSVWKLTTGEPLLAAPVPDDCLVKEQDAIAAFSPTTMCGIEIELACRLARPINTAMDLEEIAESIAVTLPAVEIFDVRALGWEELPKAFLLADLQMHGKLIIGEGIKGWKGDSELRVELGDALHSTLKWSSPAQNLLASLSWLAGHVKQQGWSLQTGDLISTGSWCGVIETAADTQIHAEFKNIGAISIDLKKLIKA
jgi:2-keto-4-pentenoate hydratase